MNAVKSISFVVLVLAAIAVGLPDWAVDDVLGIDFKTGLWEAKADASASTLKFVRLYYSVVRIISRRDLCRHSWNLLDICKQMQSGHCQLGFTYNHLEEEIFEESNYKGKMDDSKTKFDAARILALAPILTALITTCVTGYITIAIFSAIGGKKSRVRLHPDVIDNGFYPVDVQVHALSWRLY